MIFLLIPSFSFSPTILSHLKRRWKHKLKNAVCSWYNRNHGKVSTSDASVLPYLLSILQVVILVVMPYHKLITWREEDTKSQCHPLTMRSVVYIMCLSLFSLTFKHCLFDSKFNAYWQMGTRECWPCKLWYLFCFG